MHRAVCSLLRCIIYSLLLFKCIQQWTWLTESTQGQRVRLTPNSDAEYEGVLYNSTDDTVYNLKMVQPKKVGGDTTNGANKGEQRMSFQKKDMADMRAAGPNSNKADGRVQNGKAIWSAWVLSR